MGRFIDWYRGIVAVGPSVVLGVQRGHYEARPKVRERTLGQRLCHDVGNLLMCVHVGELKRALVDELL